MKDDNKKTFSDIFENVKSSAVQEETFSSLVREEVEKHNKEDLELTSTSIFSSVLNNDSEKNIEEDAEKDDLKLNDIFNSVVDVDDNKNDDKELEVSKEDRDSEMDSSNIFGVPVNFDNGSDIANDEDMNDIFSSKVNNSVSDDVDNGEDDMNSSVENANIINDNSSDNKGDIFDGSTDKKRENDVNIFQNPDMDSMDNLLDSGDSSNMVDVEDKEEDVNIFQNPDMNGSNDNDAIFGDKDNSSGDIFGEVEKKEKVVDDKLESDLLDDDVKESEEDVSPFFEDDVTGSQNSSDINPFFDNGINLIENTSKVHDTDNSIDLSNTKHYNVKIVKKKEPLLKFILGVISYAIFILLLLIGITLLIYVVDIKLKEAKGDYSTPKYNAYVVLTGSMLPEIQVNDVVITKKVDAEDLQEGDIITFSSSRLSGTNVTHRIIKKNYDADSDSYTFQTKGDNNNVADSNLVLESEIYGKVIIKIPKLGYLKEFLATKGGWIIVILIPCLSVVSYDVVKLSKGLKRKKNLKVQKK